MKILLRKMEIETDEGTHVRIVALEPEDGIGMNRIPMILKPIWCANDGLSTDYDHAEGIYWNSWEDAREQLSEHEIVTDEVVRR